MFAAFKLRAEARALIGDIQAGTVSSATPTDFFNKLSAKFNPRDAVPIISSATGITKTPSLGDILAVTGFPTASALVANFTPDFRTHMRKMIIPSDNCSAGECIWRLSYPYINVKLMEAGFFDKNSMKGIWLCGDYIQAPPLCPAEIFAKKQKYITIDTINDCDQATPPFCRSAQDTTSKQIASLFLQILLETLVDSASSKEMRTLLQEGQQGSDQVVPPVTEAPVWNAPPPHRSYLTRLTTIPLLFDIDAVKVGFGPIKTDPKRPANIRSEGIITKWKDTSKFEQYNLTGEAAICWQNIPEDISLDGIAEIINTSISNFLDQVPLTP